MSSSAPRTRSAPFTGSTTWSRIWSSMTSAMRPLMAPRAATIRCSTVEHVRDDPAHGENADDEIAERTEIVVQARHGVPETALQTEPVGQEPERLHAAHDRGDDHRHEGDGQVVVELADRLHEGPAIG